MIKNEWKGLWQNKLMLIVVIAIVAIPIIYAGLFLKSMWDPYGNVENLPVAVVNEDVPVKYEGKTLQVGKELVDELKDNDSLLFNFVDAEAAEQGLRNGTFYMVIKIPEDFSENASTLMDDNPKKMVLSYETNPGTNYIASKMSETALLKIKNSVADEVTKTYAETIFDQFDTIGDGMQDAADGALELKEGIDSAADGSKKISKNLNTLTDGTEELKDGSSELKNGITEYTDGVAQVGDGAKTLSDGTGSLKSGTATLKKQGKKYTAGVSTLSVGITSYLKGAETLADGAKQLSALESLGEVSSGISQLNTAVTTGTDSTTSLVAGMTSLKEGIGTIQKEVSNSASTLGSLSSSLTTAAQTIQAASTGIASAGEGISTASTLASKGSEVLTAGKTAIAGANTSIDQANDSISKALEALESAKAKGVDVDEEIQTLKTVGTVTKGTVDAVNTAVSGMDTISAGLTKCAAAVSAAPDQLNTAADGLSAGATQLSQADPAASMEKLSEGLKTVYNGAESLESGAKQVSSGLQTLETATASFPAAASGIKAVNEGFDTLTSNDKKLKSGAKTLKKSSPAVNQGLSSLDAGAAKLQSGSKSLVAGTQKLTANSASLVSGADQIFDGASQLASGSAKLHDGSLDLLNGMKKLQKGSKKLKNAIQDGADEVKEVDADDDTYDMLAGPVKDKESKMTKVENNGHAMAPYMMSVGLWVGCLAFCLLYPLVSYRGELTSGIAWWASKATVLYPVALLQGFVLILLLDKLAGFHPAEYGKTVAFACLTAVAFTSIMYFFNIWLGKVGSFLMLVFMVVQLAGSAGTYPVELSPAFVEKIHDYVPFTYTVNAFRSTICGGESIRQSVIVMVVLFVVFTVLSIISFHFKGVAKKKGVRLPYDWLEDQGLA